jgi:hypothetical protein
MKPGSFGLIGFGGNGKRLSKSESHTVSIFFLGIAIGAIMGVIGTVLVLMVHS